MALDRRSLQLFDLATFLAVAALLALGVVLVASAGAQRHPELFQKQLTWSICGLVAMIVLAFVDYHGFTDRAYLVWGVAVALVAATLLLAPLRAGTRSWIALGPFTVQPAEFAKVAVILGLARYFSEQEPRTFGLRRMAVPAALVLAPFALTALQPDLGTAATLIPILVGVAWVAGIERRSLGWLAVASGLFGAIGFFFLKDYQRARLLTFVEPEADPLGAGYQITQSKIAVGSGNLLGKGLFSGTQSQLAFLPEQHTDFIVAVLGEEMGFVGVATALLLYLFLLIRTLQTARLARDRAGAYLASGVATLLAFHLAVNVGMVIGFAPITGIPMPLLSYGGSATLATCSAFGLVISVRIRRFVV